MADSHLSPTTGDFTIDAAARRELLESYNELRTALQTLWECNDLWVSDLRNLETLMHRMQQTLQFQRPENAEWNGYGKWVLAEENKPAPKKRGRPKKNDG